MKTPWKSGWNSNCHSNAGIKPNRPLGASAYGWCLSLVMACAIGLTFLFPAKRYVSNGGEVVYLTEADYVTPFLSSCAFLRKLMLETECFSEVAAFDQHQTRFRLGDTQGIASVLRFKGKLLNITECQLSMERASVSSGSSSVVYISERLWRSAFDSDPRVLGAEILLSSKSHTIIGIIQSGHPLFKEVELWIPMRSRDSLNSIESLRIIARLKSGTDWKLAARSVEECSLRAGMNRCRLAPTPTVIAFQDPSAELVAGTSIELAPKRQLPQPRKKV